MPLISLNMPDDPVQLAGWLERELIGLELRQLVGELEAIQGPPTELASLNQIVGDRWPSVLGSGLSGLTRDDLRRILRQPRLLLELQERIFVEGGEYWNQVPRTRAHEEHNTAGWQRLAAQLELQTPRAEKNATTTRGRPMKRRIWIGAVAMAAAVVLVEVFLKRPAAPDTGWTKAAVALNLPEREYLEFLAGRQQHLVAPQNRAADQAVLQRQLTQLAQDCDVLLAAKLTQLNQAHREELRTRCQKWRAKVVAHLDDLKQRRKSFEQVRDEADETYRTLIKVLQEQARQVAA